MHTQDHLSLWAAKVFSQISDVLINSGTKNHETFAPLSDQNDDRAVYTHFIEENAIIMNEIISDRPHPLKMDQVNKDRFLKILGRLARERDGISRQERVFLHKFWSRMQTT